MLKKRYENEDDIPQALRDFYTEAEDGTYVLSLEGDDEAPAKPSAREKAKIKEMRDNNIALRKQLEEMQAKVDALGDLDPETVKQAMANLAKTQNDEELQLVQSGKLDEVVSRRTQKMQEAFQRQLQELQQERQKLDESNQKARGRFASVFLADQVGQALEKKKLRIRQTAKPDLMSRASRVFAPDDELESLRPTIEDYDNSGREFTLDTWLDQLVDEAPHLFEGGGGGGARPGGGGKRTTYDASSLSPEEFAKAAAEVNAGTAQWGSS